MHIATCFCWTLFFLKGAPWWRVACGGLPLRGSEGYSRLFFSKTRPSNHHVSNNEALEDEVR